MYPSLHDGDLLIASKVDYRVHAVDRGDIIILKDPMDPSRDFIKRVIGLPGDQILIRDRQVMVNGALLNEPYIKERWVQTANWPVPTNPSRGESVPGDSYFVLGDNRDHSSDSRLFGYINKGQIDGKAVVRFWPFARIDLLNVRPTLAKAP